MKSSLMTLLIIFCKVIVMRHVDKHKCILSQAYSFMPS